MLLGTVLVLLLLPGAGQASAHSALRSSDPADGSVVKTAPGAITLTFTESVGLLDDSFRILSPDNERLETGPARHAEGRGDTARVTLPKKLGTGTFTVAWRVVSADSHPVSGAFTFSIGKPSPTTAVLTTASTEDPATAALYKIGRYLAYGAAALLIGAALFVAVCRPPDPRPLRRLILTGWWLLTTSTLLLLLLRAPYEAGTGPAQAFDLSALGRTLTSRPGIALLARLALCAAAAVLLLLTRRRDDERPSRATVGGGTAIAVGLALTWAAAEHASAGIQVPAAITSSVLHLLAMASWLGGLASLLVLLRRDALPAAVAARFSRLATASVTVLALTGVYQSWRGLGSLDALTTTTYGRTLLAKLAAVLFLLLAGAFSRQFTVALVRAHASTTTKTDQEADETVNAEAEQRATVTSRVPQPVGGPAPAPAPEPSPTSDAPTATTPPLPLTEDAHRRALRRSVLVEVVVSVVVLMLTTVLTSTLPGRAVAEAADTEQSTGIPVASVTYIPFDLSTPDTPGAAGKVQVTLDPGRVGDNTVQAVVYGLDGGFVSIPELRLSFSLPAQDIGPLAVELTDRGGYWAGTVNLPIPGTWEMKATVRVSEIDQVSERQPVRIER
ncbi:copper resistance CopC/CopD family protein [Streptomyces sp. A012304]|uniref:copper resistance CopC/CopD family protein n=1 Tax=Streptomyces sp. A012304 TaxID=375446 RepID=UPI002231CED0|nr:copper resistance protein CopC [Streptomyces sp. A012304]GKQ38525.1 transport integral membrane protein [Streptomyces sp. A012304]